MMFHAICLKIFFSFCVLTTGKTTVTHSVKDSLNALLLRSPPACISQWRKTFDDEPTLIRRAFYALGNYIVASEIAKASTESPVIVDRFVKVFSCCMSVTIHSFQCDR